MLEQLTFPVLTLSQGALLVIPDKDVFSVATKHAVKSGYFEDMWLVDARGESFRVTGCEVVSEPFWRRPKTPFGRGVRLAAFKMAPQGAQTIAAIRERAIAAIEADRSTWEARGDVDRVLAALRNSNTISDILSALR
jgi:hypothetical protein